MAVENRIGRRLVVSQSKMLRTEKRCQLPMHVLSELQTRTGTSAAHGQAIVKASIALAVARYVPSFVPLRALLMAAAAGGSNEQVEMLLARVRELETQNVALQHHVEHLQAKVNGLWRCGLDVGEGGSGRQ